MAMITKRPMLNAEARAMLVGRFSSSFTYPAPVHHTLSLSLVGDESMLQNWLYLLRINSS
jgi:hypothetical protein